MMSMKNFIELAGNAAEALGVLLILGGFIVAAARFVPLRARSDTSAYLRLRHDRGRAILLGLEVLVAADIIRTVAFTPDLNGVIILAIIVAISNVPQLESRARARRPLALAASGRRGAPMTLSADWLQFDRLDHRYSVGDS
jgi:uncharacterized membrane protein